MNGIKNYVKTHKLETCILLTALTVYMAGFYSGYSACASNTIKIRFKQAYFREKNREYYEGIFVQERKENKMDKVLIAKTVGSALATTAFTIGGIVSQQALKNNIVEILLIKAAKEK